MTVIAVVPGDGIGPEVIAEAVTLLDSLGLGLDFDVLDQINADRFLTDGRAMTENDFERIRWADSVLFGAIGDPRIATPEYARSVLLRLRFELQLYVNLRPAFLWDDRLSPLRDASRRVIDCTVVRENSEGLYAGFGGVLSGGTDHEIATDEEVNTYRAVSRIIDFAFSIARRSVCLVDKSNAVRFGGALWQRCWREAVTRNRGVEAWHLYVDTAAMKLVEDPSRFDVIVANNSYGDILSDLTAQLSGGLGTAASGNINPERGYGVYEPVHGSAPDIAGKGIANPIGAVLSAALMCERLGHTGAAEAIRAAVATTIADRRCTPDLGGELGTAEAGAAIRAALR